MSKRAVTFTPPKDMAIQLGVEASKRDMSRSKLIEEICRDWLSHNADGARMRDLAGFVGEDRLAELRTTLHGNPEDEL